MESFKNILIPFDFREQSVIALSQSYNIARLSNLDITLLYVHEDSGIFSKLFSSDQGDEMVNKIEIELTDFAEKTAKETGLTIRTMVAKGRVHHKIVEVAEMIGAKFIVMGTSSGAHAKESDKKSVGANTSRVIRNAKCPVMTINGKHHYDGCRSILVPIDLTQESRQKVSWAVEMAKLFGSTIKVISILWSANHKAIVTQLNAQMAQVQKFIEDRNIKCSVEVVEAHKESETIPMILNYAKQAGDVDLVMIMTQQETSLVPFFVNSEATEIIRNSDVPVMSIVPKETGELSWR
jgi:nucleotide-binding universal stress UspA family protein